MQLLPNPERNRGSKPKHRRRLEMMSAPLPSPELVSSCDCMVLLRAGSIIDTLTDDQLRRRRCLQEQQCRRLQEGHPQQQQ